MNPIPTIEILAEEFINLLRTCHGQETEVIKIGKITISVYGISGSEIGFILEDEHENKHKIFEDANGNKSLCLIERLIELIETPEDNIKYKLLEAFIQNKQFINKKHQEIINKRMNDTFKDFPNS